MPNYIPPSVQQGCRTPKTEIFILIFDQNVEYKRPAGAYPLRDFHTICRVCIPFQDALAVKIWLDLLEGLWSHGGFKLRGSGFHQIFRGARTCSRSSITMPSLVGLGFHTPPKIGSSAPFWGGALGPHLTQSRLGKALPTYQVAS